LSGRTITLLEGLAATLPAILALISGSLWGLPLQIPFLFAIFLAGCVGICSGYRWTEIEAAALKGMSQCAYAIVVLILIGASMGIWMAAGIIPTMIYYGLQWISPRFFLAEACLLTFLMALATGSDAGAFGTLGVAILTIGYGWGIPVPITAGAITAGGIAGQLISPLSDLTAMAISTNGGSLGYMIKLIARRVIPILSASLLGYILYGLFCVERINKANANELVLSIKELFIVTPWLFLPLILLFLLIMLRVPLILVLGINLLISSILAIFLQGLSLEAVIHAMSGGYKVISNGKVVNILSKGGIASFGDIILLILLASAWAAILQHIGVLEFLLGKLVNLNLLKGKIRVTGFLIGALVSAMTCAIIPAILIPSLWLKERYTKAGWTQEYLSQDLIESSFAMASLLPWTNFNFMVVGTLGVGAFQTVPYNIFSYLIIIVGLISGFRDKENMAGKRL